MTEANHHGATLAGLRFRALTTGGSSGSNRDAGQVQRRS